MLLLCALYIDFALHVLMHFLFFALVRCFVACFGVLAVFFTIVGSNI